MDVQQVATTTTTTPGASTTSSIAGGSATTTTTVVVGDLPFTGAEIGMLAVLALSVSGLGGALVLSARGWRWTGHHRR